MSQWRHYLKSLMASAAVAGAVLLVSWTSYFIQLNDLAYDFTMRLAGPVERQSPTVIVGVDDESLERLGPWPWSRSRLAELIDRIGSAHPRAMALDFLLDTRTDDASDSALAKAIQRSSNVVLAARIDAVDGQLRWRLPFGALQQRHVSLGHVHADPDLDGVNRRVVSVKEAQGRVLPAFAFEAIRVAGFGGTGDSGGPTVVRPESLLIRFIGDHHAFPHIPAWRVLAGDVKPEVLSNKIVLLGATAEGMGDRWMTPFSESGQGMSGVEIHANAIETMVAGRAVRAVSDLFVLATLMLLVFSLYHLDRRLDEWIFYGASVAVIVVTLILSFALMRFSTVWLPFPPYLLCAGAVVTTLKVNRLARTNRDVDSKLQRLAAWDENPVKDSVSTPLAIGRLHDEVTDEPRRDRWIALIRRHEMEVQARHRRREQLLSSRRRILEWKLDALDFFNEQLVQFLSFNSAILSSIEDVIIVADPSGRVVYQNPSASRLDGFQAQAPFAPDYVSFLLDGRQFLNTFAEVLSEQKALVLDLVPSRSRRNYFNVYVAPVSAIGLVIRMNDVTAQRELNQTKNEMVSLVSHELRTPLTSIQGYSDMLLKYDLVDGKGKQFLEMIAQETRRLNQLIQSFLDVATIEAGRRRPDITEFDVQPMMRDLAAMIRPVADSKEIRVDVGVADPALRVRADRTLIYQALTNLVTNAIKYSPSNTTVRVDVLNGAGTVRFFVRDQGYGIPREEAGRIFDKFYRLANPETREQSGFGLGLAFVKEVAAGHGGDVSVESEVGKGSVFSFWIPVK